MLLSDFISAILSLWWIYTPILLFVFFKTFWMMYVQRQFVIKLKWVLLEIRIPKEVMKTPKSAEQIFSGIAGTQTAGNLIDQMIRGRVQEWFSFEIVGRGGYIHFYVYTQRMFRNLIESNVYAQYPEAEISEAEDYTKELNVEGLGKEFNVWGTELKLTKPDAYPVRTYTYFDYTPATKEEKIVDPLASLTEIMSGLKPGEQIWIQVLAMPLDDSWKKSGEALIQSLLNRKPTPKSSFLGKIVGGIGSLFSALLAPPSTDKKDAGSAKTSKSLFEFSPGEQETIKAIEDNISKLGFATKIRWLYLGKNEVFDKPKISSIFGAFKQYNSLTLNGFMPDNKTKTKIDYLMIKRREMYRKRKLFKDYVSRAFPPNFFIFNTEELASVYHFPGISVQAPTLPRIEAKKGTPPSTLPVVEE